MEIPAGQGGGEEVEARGGWLRGRGPWLRAQLGRLFWPVLVLLLVLYAAHQLFGLGGSGSDQLFTDWVNGVLLWGSAGACVVGALRERRARWAWVLVAAGLASWAIGDTIWSIRFGGPGEGPVLSVSDVFWLAWYPLMLGALALLVHDRVPAFELHRWIDGIALMLLVTIPWVALFVAPVHEHSNLSTLDDVVDFAYPICNAILLGVTIGVYALMAWRPGRMWLLLGLGLVVMLLANAVYAVQVIEHEHHPSATYSAAWVAGALLIAYASWQPHPGALTPVTVYGWRAIALPVAAQALAAAIQLYAFFREIPRSERILTLLVLVIAIVQIVVSRPRLRAPPSG